MWVVDLNSYGMVRVGKGLRVVVSEEHLRTCSCSHSVSSTRPFFFPCLGLLCASFLDMFSLAVSPPVSLLHDQTLTPVHVPSSPHWYFFCPVMVHVTSGGDGGKFPLGHQPSNLHLPTLPPFLPRPRHASGDKIVQVVQELTTEIRRLVKVNDGSASIPESQKMSGTTWDEVNYITGETCVTSFPYLFLSSWLADIRSRPNI